MSVDLARIRNLAAVAAERMRAAQPEARSAGRSWYRIENKGGANAEPAAVYIYDMIGDWGITAQDFVNDLRGVKASSIALHINSEGGEVFDGLAIYETLRSHPADITAYVDGIAASSASFIACAATRVVMAPRARMMIHDAHGVAFGNARDLRSLADLLDNLSDNIADIYADRAGGTRAQWRDTMKAAEGGPDGTWYDAAGAVRAGLADEVAGSSADAKPANRAPDGAADAPAGRDPHHAPEPVAAQPWDPAAFLGMIRSEHAERTAPPPPPLPDGAALLAGLFDRPAAP